MTMRLSRQRRRQLEKASAGVDHVVAEDRAWFEARPDRRHRVRRMTVAEIASAAAIGALKPVPAGGARFTLIRKVTPDFRLRIFILGAERKDGSETSEEIAAALWEHHRERNPNSRAHEDEITAALASRSPERRAAGGPA